MTPSELETMVRNLNTRTTAIEQILPTLATKEDLAAGLNGLEARLTVRIDDASSQARTLCERVKDDYDLLARHLANVPTEIRELHEKVAAIPEMGDDIRRLTKQVAVIPEMRGDIRQLAEQLAQMSQDLGAKLDQLAQKVDGSPRRRR